MKNTGRLVLAFFLVSQLTQAVVAQTPGSANEGKSLADIARETRARGQSSAKVLVSSPDSPVEETESQYSREIQALFARGAFADLDATADRARTSKDRVVGGVWKLYVFYDAVASPVAGDRATNTEWAQQIAKIQSWVAARPQSATPRIALAQAYRFLAWKARGGGLASTVTAAAWQEFQKQEEMAYKTLVEAEALPEKCPHLYFVLLEIARDQGWDNKQTRAVFDRAIAFEPAYYHYYREYANYLLPKWNGKPGQAEAFAEESYRGIGGRQGAFVYFEIATVIYCACSEADQKASLSWPSIKEGFTEMKEQYGTTTLKLNRFALLAYLYRDRDAAKENFVRLNDQWDPSVWRNKDTFNSVRNWVGLPSL